MKNNKGFGRFEILTLVVLGIALGAYLMYLVVGIASNQKFETMKESAVSFSKAVSTNLSSFHNSESVYLGELIDEEVLNKIKSPFSSGDCDITESKVQYIDGLAYVTLKCDKYLIDKSRLNDIEKIDIYKVGDWYEDKTDDDNEEATVFYNCLDDSGNEVFDKYYEELYFISKLNKQESSNYYFSADVTSCEVVNKTLYRTKEIYEK